MLEQPNTAWTSSPKFQSGDHKKGIAVPRKEQKKPIKAVEK